MLPCSMEVEIMTTIYMHPTKSFEMVKLSDGSQASVDVEKTPEGPRYQFWFKGHTHSDFWCDDSLKNGQKISVESINGPEEFQIKLGW